jgi:adenylate cyclase
MADGEHLRRWIEAGFYDPDANGADGTRLVLEFYESIGVDPADYEGVAPDDLIPKVNNRFLRPGPRISANDVRDAVGLSDATFSKLCRAAGYSPDGEFTEIDVEGFKSFAIAGSMFTEEALLEFARVLTAAMAKVADATSALFRVDVAPQVEADGGAEVEYARLNYQTSSLIDVIYAPMKAFFLNQLIDAVRLSDQGRQAVTSTATTTIKVAVGFVDIVGYTRLSASVSPDDLARFIRDFEAQAIGLVADNGGRLVKLIGDEVMFVALDPGEAVAVAAAILEAFGGTDSAPRAGIAYGEVVALGGDYYGEIVNLASRITDQAVPGEVLVDEATASATSERCLERAGRRQLKGFDQPISLSALVLD